MRWRWWYRLTQRFLYISGCALWRLRAWGRENVPREGGVLLVSNHQSFLDPMLVGGLMNREMHFLARSTLFRNPVFGALIATYNAIPINREAGDVKGVKSAIERLRSGHALLVFPEGTRTRDGKIARIKPGLRLLAGRAKVPVVPVLIEGAYDVWPRHRLFPGSGRINVLFGKPIAIDGLSDAELGERVREGIVSLARQPHRKPITEI